MTPRLMDREKQDEDAGELSLRPQMLSEFIGQAQARANLKVFIDAARARGDALDHVLFAGPPGLGKTTLAQIVARELGVNFKMTSGPVIVKAGDLPRCSPILRNATFFLSMRFTGLAQRSRKSSIPRWRISSSI